MAEQKRDYYEVLGVDKNADRYFKRYLRRGCGMLRADRKGRC